jgi:hypothetical protein
LEWNDATGFAKAERCEHLAKRRVFYCAKMEFTKTGQENEKDICTLT